MGLKKFLNLFVFLSLCGCSGRAIHGETLKFFYAGNDADYQDTFIYSDDYFDKPSTEYNPSLVSASIAFAMASFASTRESDGSYSKRFQNSESFLRDIGFGDFYANQYYKIKPGTDTFGVVVARKKINGIETLAVGTRGKGYETEWASNLTVGSSEEFPRYMQGFYEASQILLSSVKEYIGLFDIKGEIRLWHAGYSRAGGTTNLAVGQIDESIRDNTNIFGNDIILKKENVYGFCFEPPQGLFYDEESIKTFKGEDFNNIYNFVNVNDVVPKTGMTALGVTRYGKDIYLTDSINDINYDKNITKVINLYKKLPDSSSLGDYHIDDFKYMALGGGGKLFSLGEDATKSNWTLGLYLDRLMDDVFNYLFSGSRDLYNEEIVPAIRAVAQIVYANAGIKSSLAEVGLSIAKEFLNIDDSAVLIDDLLHMRSRFIDDFFPMVSRGLLTLGIVFDKNTLRQCVSDISKGLLRVAAADFEILMSLFSMDNIKTLGFGHYPNLCLAHIRAMDPAYVKDPIKVNMDGRYYILETKKISNIEIKNKSKVVASVFDGEVDQIKSSIASGFVNKETFRAYLPINADFEIMFEEAEDSTVNLYLRDDNLRTTENVAIDITKDGSVGTFSVKEGINNGN